MAMAFAKEGQEMRVDPPRAAPGRGIPPYCCPNPRADRGRKVDPMSHTLASPQGHALPLPDLRGAARRGLRRLRDLYALGVDPVWFALAVILGLMVAGWGATLLGLPVDPPAQDWIRL